MKPSPKQIKIINGLMLGDGWITKLENGGYRLETSSVRENYIDWIEREFDNISSWTWSEEPSEINMGNQTKHMFRTAELPWLEGYHNRWYDDGQNVLPDSLSLKPLTAKIWFVGDGSINWSRARKRNIHIGASRYQERAIKKCFRRIGIDPNVTPRGRITLSREGTEVLYEHMGEPIPGYEYKFSSEFEEYEKLKPEALK